VAYVLLELVVVPLGVLLLALSWVPLHQGRKPFPGEMPANAMPTAVEPGAVLLADPRRRPAR